MPPFTSSAKPIQYFVSIQSAGIDKLAKAVGDRLERLTQCERYQLSTCIAMYLWYLTELTEEEEVEETLMGSYDSMISLIATGNVLLCLSVLNAETPDTLADLLTAIAQYASNPSMEANELEEQESYQDELVLSKLKSADQAH